MPRDVFVYDTVFPSFSVIPFQLRYYKKYNSMDESNTVVSAYTMYRHLQQYCSHPSNSLCILVVSVVSATSSIPVSPAEPHSSVDSVQDFRTGGRWFDPRARPIFFPRINGSHCDRIYYFLTFVHCFGNVYVGKAASGFERILCRVLVKGILGKYG